MSTPAMYERKLAEVAALEARLAEAERQFRAIAQFPCDTDLYEPDCGCAACRATHWLRGADSARESERE